LRYKIAVFSLLGLEDAEEDPAPFCISRVFCEDVIREGRWVLPLCEFS